MNIFLEKCLLLYVIAPVAQSVSARYLYYSIRAMPRLRVRASPGAIPILLGTHRVRTIFFICNCQNDRRGWDSNPRTETVLD